MSSAPDALLRSVVFDLGSDDNGCRVRLGGPNNKQQYPRWNIKMDKDLFRAAVIAGTWQRDRVFESSELADNSVMKVLTDASNTVMPKVKNNGRTKKNPFWWTSEISDARKEPAGN